MNHNHNKSHILLNNCKAVEQFYINRSFFDSFSHNWSVGQLMLYQSIKFNQNGQKSEAKRISKRTPKAEQKCKY
jgi:hypothetical protein